MGDTHWKLTLSYDGSHFHGWQVQPGLTTVQGVLADVLEHITGERTLPQGSGRTDAGVHALAQVASVSLQVDIPAANLLRALNRVLPAPVRVISVEAVTASFHARHSARRKTYEYRIFERRSPGLRHAAAGLQPEAANTGVAERICSPFLAPYVWDCRWPLDLDRLQAAASLFCGTQDFTSFAASDPERGKRGSGELDRRPNPLKTIFRSGWTREHGLLVYRVTGSGFLHHMVRTMVGTLADVGRGSFEPHDIPRILRARDRAAAGPTAPARGLFLHSVEYPVPDQGDSITTGDTGTLVPGLVPGHGAALASSQRGEPAS